ncbi:MAG: hypothetical protein ACTSVL_11690 [Promethearchaeota archaeon]
MRISRLKLNKQFNAELVRLKSLLNQQDYYWAIVYTERIIEKLEIRALSKMEQDKIILEILDLWEENLISIIDSFSENWPFIYNVYQIIFDLLVLLKDYSQILQYGFQLANILVKYQLTSRDLIANFLEVLAQSIKDGDLPRSMQILFIAIAIRKKYVPNVIYNLIFQSLDHVFQFIPQPSWYLLIYGILELAYLQFFQSEADLFDQEGFNNFIIELKTAFGPKFPRKLRFAFSEMQDHPQNPILNLEQWQLIYEFTLELMEQEEILWATMIFETYSQLFNLIGAEDKISLFLKKFMEFCRKRKKYDISHYMYYYFEQKAFFLSTNETSN